MERFRHNLQQITHPVSLSSVMIMTWCFCGSLINPFSIFYFFSLWSSQNGYEENTGIMTTWHIMEVYKWIHNCKWWILHSINCDQCLTQHLFTIYCLCLHLILLLNYIQYVGFEDLTAKAVKSSFFWDITLCSVAEIK